MESKPIKYVYKIFASNQRVHVKYIPEESYQRHRDNQWAWSTINLGDVTNLDKEFYIFEPAYDFGTGDMADKFIKSKQEEYIINLKAWDDTPRELPVDAANDNYTIKIQRENLWRLENLNGTVYK